jgi:pimeloyl-ACP methyl ester carboxylesterase
MAPVVGPISAFAQAVLYDRAGLGMSKPPAEPGRLITARGVADALDQLLAQARLHPPSILVGHSLGGLYVQMFARRPWCKLSNSVVTPDFRSVYGVLVY